MAQSVRYRRLEVNRLDKHFHRLRSAEKALRVQPIGGWVKTIREALGMSATQLAERLGVSRNAIYLLEEREGRRKTTLKQLDKAAAALGCDVVYTLIPNQSLEQTIRGRARIKAEAQLREANASMGLEAEGVQGDDFAAAVSSASSFTEALTDRQLWDD